MRRILLIIAAIISLNLMCAAQDYKTLKASDKNGYSYEYVTNDPTSTRIYTLKNGLKLYLSVNKDKPRILGFIAVRAGSKNDPAETTGLAHYFEHLMFKGTDEIGTINWEKEKPLIEEISDLFEQHRNETDPVKKSSIYSKIDSVSYEASKYAAPSEYDKLAAYIGAEGTNAWTSFEETVYTNEIPSNELGRWLKIESERFSKPVFRLFHTELETVYEEFNMSQDSDGSRSFDALLSGLYPHHQYGTQTTLGKGGHLKNPSMVNIMKFFETYYVPNNMAICLSGDLDYESTVKLIDRYWGDKPSKPVPEFIPAKEDPIPQPVVKEVFGPDAESVMFGFRFEGAGSEQIKYLDMINSVLYNGKAGLIDNNLVQQQKVLSAYSWTWEKKDYTEHIFGGTPREGQSLDEVKELLLSQIEKVKKGEFEDWMLTAAVNQRKLGTIYSFEGNWRAHSFVNAFIEGKTWEDVLKYNSELEKITKKDIVDFANEYYKDNYVIVYKREGKDSTIMKVDKPKITPVTINRDTLSAFYSSIKNIKASETAPEFLDYKKIIKEKKINSGVGLKYIKNTANELFSLYYLVETGTNHNPKYKNAVEYLDYLGTEKFSPKEFKQELYKNGLDINFWSNGNRSYISISGLDRSLEKGLELMYDLMSNAKPDKNIYADYVKGVLKQRDDFKKDKDIIFWSALQDYARYGEGSPFRNVVSSDDLQKTDPSGLVSLVKEFLNYKHSIMYYGPREIGEVAGLIKKEQPEIKYADTPARKDPAEIDTYESKVYFVNFDMVQMNMIMLSKLGKLDLNNMPVINVFNEYFDGGMSRLVFQEIREAQGLAYATGASYGIPETHEKSHYLFTYIMTQPDKFKSALNSMEMLLNNMPRIDKNFNDSIENIRKRIQSERIIKTEIFWNRIANADMGIDYDIRKNIYDEVKSITIDKMFEFYNKEVKDKKFVYLIMADKNRIDFKELEKLGKVEELTLEKIFGY
jgi:zinc protease